MTVGKAFGEPKVEVPFGPHLPSASEKSLTELRRNVKDVLGTNFTDVVIDRAILKVQERLGDSGATPQGVISELLDNGASPTPASSPTAATAAPPLVDLTGPPSLAPALGGEDTEMQKAIAASLGDSAKPPALSKEEAELQRALAESIQDAPSMAAFQILKDPANPHARTRQPDWPAGLKNIGNTCWFNVVLQALFTLPRFRHLIFSCPEAKDEAAPSDQAPSPRLEFMRELQRMFGLLLGSQRAYVDPTAVVELLRAQSPSLADVGRQGNTQEDVSEVTHSLMALIESGFREVSAAPGGESPSLPSIHPPMAEEEMTYEPGTVIEELFHTAAEKSIIRTTPGSNILSTVASSEARMAGVSGGGGRLEQHLLLPLEVVGQESVHEGLEAALFSDIDDAAAGKSETWLIRAPPILLLDLKRFAFSKEKRAAEKLHSRLAFPPTLYMDRFLKRNKEDVSARRAHVNEVKEQIRVLKTRVLAYEKYGGGGEGGSEATLPLAQILALTRSFVCGSDVDSGRTASEPIPVPSPPCTDSPMDTDSGKASPRTTAVADAMEVEPSPDELRPSAAVSDLHREVVKETLGRLIEEVNADLAELHGELAKREAQVASAYSVPELQQAGYRLHAVLVHEGSVSSGHYWAFIRDAPTADDADEVRPQGGWKKFNDVKVSPCGWEEVVRDSFGGSGRFASAYCLLYVAHSQAHEIYHNKGEAEEMSGLSAGLQSWVAEDRRKLAEELRAWDAQSARVAPPTPPSDPPQVHLAEEEWGELVMANAKTVSDIAEYQQQLTQAADAENPKDALEKAVTLVQTVAHSRISLWSEFVSGAEAAPSGSDPRLSHPLHVALSLSPLPPPDTLRRLLLFPAAAAPAAPPAIAALLAEEPVHEDTKERILNINKAWVHLRESAVVLKKVLEEFLKNDHKKDRENLRLFCFLMDKEQQAKALEPSLVAYPAFTDVFKLLTIIRIGADDMRSFWTLERGGLDELWSYYRTRIIPLLLARPCASTKALALEVQAYLANIWNHMATLQAQPSEGRSAAHGEIISQVLNCLWELETELKSGGDGMERFLADGMKAKIKVSSDISGELESVLAKTAASQLLPAASVVRSALLSAAKDAS